MIGKLHIVVLLLVVLGTSCSDRVSGPSDLPRYTLGALPPNVLLTGRDASGGRLPAPVLDAALYFKHMPPPRRMDLTKLLKKMGKDFDPQWMSIQDPTENSSDEPKVASKPQLDLNLLEQLKDLNFTYMDDDTDLTVYIKPQVQKIMEKWLLEKASCQVQYKWDDIGALFWPRWIRNGVCSEERACSWPPGMHCVAAESSPIRLLRWQCRSVRTKSKRKSNRKHYYAIPDEPNQRRSKKNRRSRRKHKKHKIRCRWIKVPYPITSECFCSC